MIENSDAFAANSVKPLGSDALTASTDVMAPSPPALFSTTTGRPMPALIFSAPRRAMRSGVPPGGPLTTILTEQFGNSCALVTPTTTTAIAPAKTTPPIKRILSPVRAPWLVGRFEQGDYFIRA